MYLNKAFFGQRVWLYVELSWSLGLGGKLFIAPAPFREVGVMLLFGPLEIELEIDY